MRYMDLEGHMHKVYRCSGYTHNSEGFYKKIIYQMSINRERMTITRGAHASLVRILFDNMTIKHENI